MSTTYQNQFSSAFSSAFDPDPTPDGAIVTIDDLPETVISGTDPALLQVLIDGANAKAGRVAPCLLSDDPPPTQAQLAEARLVLIGAVTRWSQTGSGAYQQQTAGPFSVSVDTRQRGGYNLWPSEIEELEAICAGVDAGQSAFSIRPDAACGPVHLRWCSVHFSRTWGCSCGADLAGRPIQGVGVGPDVDIFDEV